jgi:hypothetical protein
MDLRRNYDRYDGIIITSLIAVFATISNYFFWFTLDDAYITLRYSKHLANGNGLVWNIMSSDPVEGYTSFLWVLIGAIPHVSGLPAVDFVKVAGILATMISMIFIYIYGRKRGINRIFLAIGCAQLGVSPAIAVLSVQGMETTTAMLLILIASIGALELVKTYSRRWAIVMNVALLSGMLARPDLVIYAIVLEASTAGVLYYKNRIADIWLLVRWGFILTFIPGIVYMISRFLYFGYLFPNPFYVKTSDSLLAVGGAVLTFEFVMLILGPLLFISIFSLVGNKNTDRLINTLPVFFASSAFLSLYLFVRPLQGFLWRFQVPVFATFILGLLIVLNPKSNDYNINTVFEQKTPLIMTLLLVSGLIVYPLFTFPQATSATSDKTPGDRVVMGQGLNSVTGDHRMFVTESGALPYYSEWNAVDEWGLNSEYIAHNGLTESYLREYNPDLINMLVRGQPGLIQSKSPQLARFIDNSSYRLVAVVNKQNRDGSNIQTDSYHVYFVDENSDKYQNISCTLLTQDINYASRSAIHTQAEINVQSSNITQNNC